MITRDAAHRYTYEGITYPGVTTILGMLDKSGPLMGWAARQTAEAAVQMTMDGIGDSINPLLLLIDTVGKEGAIKALSSRSNWQRDEAAQLGTEVHSLADLVVRGADLPTMTDTQRKRVEHYAKWWEASGWKVRLSEAMVVHRGEHMYLPHGEEGPEFYGDELACATCQRPRDGHSVPSGQSGWGGTFDLLAYDKDGKTVLADIKTGKAVYKEAVLQLAAYGMASIVQPTLDTPMVTAATYPMPLPDRYVILHVTADGVREVEVAVGTAERMAFLSCLDLYHWNESMKGKRL